MRTRLAQQKALGLYRTRQTLASPQGAEVTVANQRYLSFCSNDYLGLANHPDVIKALQQGAARYGVGSGASHLITGHSSAHHQLEEELAAFTGRPRALLFSTGYMANLGVVSALAGRGDTIYEDRLNHASLIDAARLAGAKLRRYEHTDSSSLETELETHHSNACSGQTFIVSDGVFSMDGDIAPVPDLVQLAQRHDALLMIDDAHGLGVIGAEGRGTLEYFNLNTDQVPILVGTLGKAFGTFGAFVAGSEDLIETLIQQARTYIYTTALPPAIAHATRTSLRLVCEESWRREHLTALIMRFRDGAAQLGISTGDSNTPIQPLIIGDAEKTNRYSQLLKDQGILISAIRPPTVPKGSARLRITLTAAHSEVQVDRLLDALASVIKISEENLASAL